jgi:hypothetical protein
MTASYRLTTKSTIAEIVKAYDLRILTPTLDAVEETHTINKGGTLRPAVKAGDFALSAAGIGSDRGPVSRAYFGVDNVIQFVPAQDWGDVDGIRAAVLATVDRDFTAARKDDGRIDAGLLPDNLKADYQYLRRGMPPPNNDGVRAARMMERMISSHVAVESDEGEHKWAAFSVVLHKGVALTPAAVARAAGVPKSVKAYERTGGAADFFASIDNPELGYSKKERDAYDRLDEYMKQNLTDVRYLHFGGEERVFGTRVIVGRAKDGTIAGIRAGRVWT